MKDGYYPRGSGLLKGSGLVDVYSNGSRRNHKSLKNDIPNCYLTDIKSIKELVPDPQEGIKYTERELALMTEKILLNDSKHWKEHPYWIPMGPYLDRLKKEIYTARGYPDPSIVEGLYVRTHPNGRKLRKKGEGFYK